MRKSAKLNLILMSAFVLAGISVQPASARLLACTCDGGPNCRLQHGREQQDYTYDPKNMGAAYDAIEKTAMDQADAKAVDKANDALNSDTNMRCGNPCGAPILSILHGPPFAGGMDGSGMARSLWEVRYVCKKPVVPPPPPPKPVHPGPASNGGGVHEPPVGGDGPREVNIKLPTLPKCFGLPVDKDDFLEELHKLRLQQTLGPLGVDKDDPELIEWQAQATVNIEAIDAAIKQAEETPYCPPKHHSSLFDHLQIGIGVGEHDHRDHYHDDRRGHDDRRDVKHVDGDHHTTSHDDYPKTDAPPQEEPHDRH